MRSRRLVDWIQRSVRGWQRQSRQLASRVRDRSNRRIRRAVLVAGIAATIGGLLLARVAPWKWLSHESARWSATGGSPRLDVYFSPRGHCTDAIVRELVDAKATVLVQAYSFTSAAIAKAIVDAHKRGVHVQVILDKGQRSEKYSSADFLAHAGIPTMIDARHAIAHNKVMVIDGEVVLTGSFNFTEAAEERNAENLLVVRNKAIAEKYTANWNEHAAHSEEYEGR
jgi:phosphatidylserine/phosphatidylglycerophosphate/cardiolipin synthase-like enzyme